MKKKVYAYLHTHWDREWYRTHQKFRLRLVEVFDEILLQLENDEIPSFYFDGQSGALEDYLEIRPEKKELIQKIIKEKKLFVGPFFCSTDCYLINAVAFARNIELGLKTAKEFGCEDFCAYLCDIFAHPKGSAPILKAYNLDYAIIWRAIGNTKSEVIWENLKTVRLVRGYFMDFLHPKKPNFEALKQNLDKIARYSSDKIFLPIGADHLSVLNNAKEKIKTANEYLEDYEIKICSPFEYFKDVKFEQKLNGELLDNSITFILPGVYSSRIYQKQQNAKLQWDFFRIVEPFDAFLGGKYRAQLAYALKLLIKNHAHDSIYGCSIDEVHNEVDSRFCRTKEIVHGVLKCAIRDISSKTDNIKIFNASNFEYSGVVKLSTDKKLKNAQIIGKKKFFTDEKLYDASQIPVTEDITTIYDYLIYAQNLPPFSLTDCKFFNYSSELNIGPNVVSNSKIALETQGETISLTDKEKNLVMKNFIKIKDTADNGDSYNHSPASKPHYMKFLYSKIIEKGPLRSILRLYYDNFHMDAIIYQNSDFIEFKTKWKNKKKNHRLQVEFAFADNLFETEAEDILSTVKRKHDPHYSLFENQPAPKGVELKTNTFPMQRFVSTKGVGIITEGLNEYEIYKNTLSITLLRAAGIISNPANPARGTPAGPPIETKGLQCLRDCEARFALTFNENVKDLYRVSESFYGCTVAMFSDAEDKMFLKSNNLVYGIKSIDDNKMQTYSYDFDNNKFLIEVI